MAFGIDDIVGGLLGMAKTWLTGRVEKQKAQQEMKIAEMQNKARLLRDELSNNHAWQMAALTDKDKWLRRASFAMFASPFIVAIFAPQHVRDYFDTAIAAVPIWWQKAFMSITGVIWGISSLANTAPRLLEIFKK